MVLRPPRSPIHCPACGWEGSMRPLSDALVGFPETARCPRCRYAPLEMGRKPRSFSGPRKPLA